MKMDRFNTQQYFYMLEEDMVFESMVLAAGFNSGSVLTPAALWVTVKKSLLLDFF